MDEGNGPVGRGVMIATVAFGFIVLCVVAILKMLTKLNAAKASAAWARAAQLDAQANLVDARTAQLGMMMPVMLGFLLVIAALVLMWSVAYLLKEGRRRDRLDVVQVQMLVQRELRQLPPPTELIIPMPHTGQPQPHSVRENTRQWAKRDFYHADPDWPTYK